MAVNAYDVQVCLWKMLKFSSKICVTVSTKHPYVASSVLCLLLLYICFPLVFWILIYSLPLVVCTCIILCISSGLWNDTNYREDVQGENGGICSKKAKFAAGDHGDDKSKKPYTRVHSVRRRRAREFTREDDVQNNVEEKNAVFTREDDVQSNVEEKNAVSSTNFNCDMVDKKALIEESPKEIREVEVDFALVRPAKDASPSASQSLKLHENDVGPKPKGVLVELLKDEEEANKAMQGNEDDQKNVMDVGISDAERNKRLESLIARRRSRKLLSLQVRRSLMNMDRNDRSGGQIPALALPKINTSFSPNKFGGPYSPGPGSAPSILVPMRNPFDLPYDPHEEKPDLTRDSFQQEFASVHSRDMVFCRHESFSLGPSLSGERFHNREEASSVHGFGFRQRGYSTRYRFSQLGNESDKEFEPIMEQESCELSEPKSDVDSPDDDQIKEIIQVYENGTNDHSEGGADEVETRRIPEEGFTSSSSSSQSSSEEEQPVFKIDKEAILKSLSFMRRNTFQEIENHEQIGDNLSYANSALENASRLKQQFYAEKPTCRHAPSYSIASDLQVEVSEISSPPLTIDENMSYQDEDVSTYDGEMERNISWDGEDLWARSSHISEADEIESRSTQVNEVNDQDITEAESSRTKEPEDTALSISMEEPLNEKHCIHSCSPDAEFSDNGDKILQDESECQIKEYAAVESNSGMEHLAAESMKSSEDSEEMVEVSTTVENHVNIEPVQHNEDEQSSAEASTSQAAMDSNDPQEQSTTPNVAVAHVQSSMISPKSVLLPTFSMSSFDPDIDEEVQQSGAHAAEVPSPVAVQNSSSLMGQSSGLPCSNGDAEASQEASEPTNASTIEGDDTDCVNEKTKIQENDEQPSSEILGIHQAPAETKEKTSSVFFISTDEVSSKDFEAANPNVFSKNVDHTDDLISSLSTVEEMVTEESTHNDSTKSSSYEDQAETSALHEEKEHEMQTNSTTSNCTDGTKDEVRDLDADETPATLSGPVEDNESSEPCKKNDPDRKDEQYANSHEAMPETTNTLDNETKQLAKEAQEE